MNNLSQQLQTQASKEQIGQSCFLEAQGVPCGAWDATEYQGALKAGYSLWIPYDVNGLMYSNTYLAKSPVAVEVFRFRPKLAFTHQQLMLMDLTFLPKHLSYWGELYKHGSNGDSPLIWVPYPKDSDLESWFVARDRGH